VYGLDRSRGPTDGNGNVTASYTYDVFGATRSQSGTADTVFRFTGEQRDVESGLYYLRARFYDPAIGRFLARDPLPGGNLYAYVGSNPTNLIDPTGLQAAGNAAAAACAAAAIYGGTATAATAGGGGVTVVAAGGGVTAVCAGALAVAVCDAGGCEMLADVAGAAGNVIISAGGAVVEGAKDLAGEVGGWLGFGKKSKPKEPRYYDPKDPGLRNIGHDWTRPTLQNFPWRGCHYFKDWRLRAACWTFLAGGAGYVLEQFAPVLIGEKPPRVP
jgi:RHS repeat-associated protein